MKMKYIIIATLPVLILALGIRWLNKPAVLPKEEVVFKKAAEENHDKDPAPIEMATDDVPIGKPAKQLRDNEIKNELEVLQEKIENNNLIERLNKNVVSEEERKNAAYLLERITELGVEKAQRDFLSLQGEFEDTLLETKTRLDSVRNLLETKDP